MQTQTIPVTTLQPGQTIIPYVGATPEVVYHTEGYRLYRNIQTNGGERTIIPPTVEVVLNSDAPHALRRADPEQLYQHFSLPYGHKMGADPEVFVVDERGEVLPAFVYLPEKTKPKISVNETRAFYDGFQAEFTVPAEACLGYLTDWIREGLQNVRAAARAQNPKAKMVVDGVLPIPYDMRRAVDPKHLALGCAPSKNVYGEGPMSVPSPEDLGVRFAGSHMHFGLYNIYRDSREDHRYDLTQPQIERAVRMLDAVVGVGMVSFGEGVQNPMRRQYYGRAGEYRYSPKDQRIEYRVPDVHLIAHPATMNLWWETARLVIKMGVVGMDFLWDAHPEEVRGTINEYDVPKAREILRRNENVLRAILRKTGRAHENLYHAGPEWVEMGVRTILHGIGSAVRDPKDIEGNWWLDAPTREFDLWLKNYDEDPTCWRTESLWRKHELWPMGRIWSSAAKLLAEGKMV